MRRFASQYRDFFRLPDVAALVTVALLSRMPIGMVGLAMLLFLRESLGSYALAGTVSGVYFTAMAIAAPVQGRLIDRSGPRLTVAVTGIAHPIALGAVLAGALAGAGLGAVASAAAVAG
ncbi:MAG: MFS transporter, partial [Burkholderiales bacterium]|nr:MFS transporter [Burkholderiales bacterium]